MAKIVRILNTAHRHKDWLDKIIVRVCVTLSPSTMACGLFLIPKEATALYATVLANAIRHKHSHAP